MTRASSSSPAANGAIASPAALLLVGTIAALGWGALGTDFVRSIGASLAEGASLGEALFRFFRFFSILTNIGVAIFMTATFLRLCRGLKPPPTGVFNAVLVYILVTGLTYEAILRRLWTPRGLQFVTDTIIHDVVPLLTLILWLFVSPRSGGRWRDAAWILVYPALYLGVTPVAGAVGQGYPYGFLDVGTIGYAGVVQVAGIFLAIFYALGLATTAVTRRRDRQSRRLPSRILS